MVVCSHCYHENPDDAGYCTVCSAPLPTKSSCPSCGATVLSDANFCGQCGTKLRGLGSEAGENLPMFSPTSITLDGRRSEARDQEVIAPDAEDPAIAEASPAMRVSVSQDESGGIAIATGNKNAATSPASGETLSDAEAEWLAEDDADEDLDDLELSWEAPASEPLASSSPVTEVGDFETLMATMAVPDPVAESEVEPEVEPTVEEEPNGAIATPNPPDPSAAAPVAEQPDPAPEAAPIETPEAVQEQDEDVAEAATVLQTHEKGQLLHLQTNTAMPIPKDQKVVHIGKSNSRLKPDIDVANFPHAEIVSRVHADLHWDGSSYYLEDTGSANGTFVNSWPLPSHRRYQLRDGDRISLGKHDLISFVFQIVS